MDPLTILTIGGKILDKLTDYFPSAEAKAKVQLGLLEMQQTGQLATMNNELAKLQLDFDIAKGQIDVNRTEAESTSTFRAGWRPFIGWTCGVAFATQFVIGPVATYVGYFFGKLITLPQLDFTAMMPVLLGMLGLGTMRSFEKIMGTK